MISELLKERCSVRAFADTMISNLIVNLFLNMDAYLLREIVSNPYSEEDI